MKEGVRIVSFCDNNKSKWDTTIAHGIICVAPEEADWSIPIVVAVNVKHAEDVRRQVQGLGGKIIGTV